MLDVKENLPRIDCSSETRNRLSILGFRTCIPDSPKDILTKDNVLSKFVSDVSCVYERLLESKIEITKV